MNLVKYARERVNSISKTMINKESSSHNAILMYLAGVDMAPCFEVSNFLRCVADEREVHNYVENLRDLGLVKVYEVLKTPIYEITPFGRVVARRIESFEVENKYPFTNDILEKTARGLMKERHPELAEKIDALAVSIFSVPVEIASATSD